MSDEEAKLIRQLIREELSGLVDIQAADGVRITRTEETAQTLLSITQNLVTLVHSHDERMDALTVTGRCQEDCVNGNNQLHVIPERNDYADYSRTLRRTTERLQITRRHVW
jgi:hypothetical protein